MPGIGCQDRRALMGLAVANILGYVEAPLAGAQLPGHTGAPLMGQDRSPLMGHSGAIQLEPSQLIKTRIDI